MIKIIKLFSLIAIFSILLSFANTAEARSGCCSHHGGVSGCGCADGTPLSSTCRPYYPECNSTQPQTYTYQKPTTAPTSKPTIKLIKKVSITPSKKAKKVIKKMNKKVKKAKKTSKKITPSTTISPKK